MVVVEFPFERVHSHISDVQCGSAIINNAALYLRACVGLEDHQQTEWVVLLEVFHRSVLLANHGNGLR